MTQAKLITAQSVLGFAKPEIPQNLVDAFSLSMVWAQAVAAKSAESPGSELYFSELTQELSRIWWIVEDATNSTFTSDGANNSAAASIGSIAKPYVGANRSIELTKILSGFGDPSPSPSIAQMLTTWWASQSQDVSSTSFSVCPLTIDANGQLNARLFFLDFDVARSGWQSFFLVHHDQKISVNVSSVDLALQAKPWASIRDKIAAKLGASARNYIRQLDISF
jgi:hypothetical protein